MAKAHVSDSADQASDSDDDSGSASEEVETPRKISARKKISNYERQRMERIEENKARMEAMGLKKMANAFQSSVPKQTNKSSGRKGNDKRKADDEDEEYRPSEEEGGFNSSSAEDEKDGGGDGDDDDEDFDLARTRKKVKRKIQTPKKRASCQKRLDFSDDDDEALKQAIALSLQDSVGFTDESNVASQSYSSHPIGNTDNAREGNSHIQEDMGKRKRKKSINSRVQMTEDELIIHFFQFDEAGKGYINLRDLKRIAVTHDFIWHEKEMADMILHFDSDGDGKLSLEDFRKIAGRCNMIQG